jgi:hypothetical protein
MKLTKKLIYWWLCVIFSFLSYSCLETEQQPSPSILGEWQVKDLKLKIFVDGIEVPVNYVGIDSAALTVHSNTMLNFMSDGRYITKTLGKPDSHGTWVLTADELKLIMDKNTAYEKIFEVKKISDDDLHLFIKKDGKSTNSNVYYLLESDYFFQKIL